MKEKPGKLKKNPSVKEKPGKLKENPSVKEKPEKPGRLKGKENMKKENYRRD